MEIINVVSHNCSFSGLSPRFCNMDARAEKADGWYNVGIGGKMCACFFESLKMVGQRGKTGMLERTDMKSLIKGKFFLWHLSYVSNSVGTGAFQLFPGYFSRSFLHLYKFPPLFFSIYHCPWLLSCFLFFVVTFKIFA